MATKSRTGRNEEDGSPGLLAVLSPDSVDSWSGRPDSNRRQPAWKAGTLPLSYSRSMSKHTAGHAPSQQEQGSRVLLFSASPPTAHSSLRRLFDRTAHLRYAGSMINPLLIIPVIPIKTSHSSDTAAVSQNVSLVALNVSPMSPQCRVDGTISGPFPKLNVSKCL